MSQAKTVEIVNLSIKIWHIDTGNERTRSAVPTVAEISLNFVATDWGASISGNKGTIMWLLFLFPIRSSGFCLFLPTQRRASPPSLHGMTRRLCSCSSTSCHFFCSLFSRHLFTRSWTRYTDEKTTAEVHNDRRRWGLVYETATSRPPLRISIVGVNRWAARSQQDTKRSDDDTSVWNAKRWQYSYTRLCLFITRSPDKDRYAIYSKACS